MARMYHCAFANKHGNVDNYRWQIIEEDVYGSWEVVECESPANFENCSLDGSILTLDEAGDIKWRLNQTPSDYLPFLTCDSYELEPCPDCKYRDCDQDSLALKLNLLGSESGERVPFLLTLSREKTIMTIRYQYSPVVILKCKKVQEDKVNAFLSSSYSLLPALQNGLFTDLKIIADNGEQFEAHKVVLLCACPTIDWSTVPPPLSNWPSSAIAVTLHYFYSGCLPPDVQEETIENIHTLLKNNKGMKELHEICAQYLESTALKRKISNLLNCIYGVVDEAYDVLNGMKNKDTFTSPHGNGLCDQRNILEAFQEIARHLTLALARFALFCEIFTKYKNEMTRDERHEIIKSLKSRLLAVDDKLRQCADIFLESLSCLTQDEQTDLARFLVPKIDDAVEIGTKLAMDGKDALDKIVQTSDHEYRKKPKKKVGMKLSKALRMSMFSKEIQFLKKLQEKAASGYVFFFQRREDFNSLPADGKATLVLNCIQHVTLKGADKLDQFTLRESKFNVKNWKSFTKIVTSKLTWLINKVKFHKNIVEPIVLEICELVKLEEFSNVVEELVCINCKQTQDEKDPCDSNPRGNNSSATTNLLKAKTKDSRSVGLVSPSASVNLAKCMGTVLETGQHADMRFLICDGSEPLLTDGSAADEGGSNCLGAHRVVLASRCDWFRRALTSGMKESIERTIHVYDTDKESFQEFLKFIYTGYLETESKSLENLVELVALADQYEVDNLKAVCEQGMVKHFKKDNVFEILILADRFNAPNLKGEVLHYISSNFTEKDIRHNKDFFNLSKTLQKDLLAKYTVSLKRTKPVAENYFHFEDSCSEDSDVDSENFSFSPAQAAFRFHGLHLSESESSEEEEFLSNTLQDRLPVDKDSLEDCIRGLQEVLPSDVGRGKLMEIALAADCDINRALNHYFS
mgnify:FL=1